MPQPYQIKRGSSELWKARIAPGGVVRDITSDTVSIIVKKNKTDKDSEAVFAFTNGPGQHSDPTNGWTEKTQTAAETKAIPAGQYWCAIKWYHSDGVTQEEFDTEQVEYVINLKDNT